MIKARVTKVPRTEWSVGVYEPWGMQRDHYYEVTTEVGRKFYIQERHMPPAFTPVGTEGYLLLVPRAPGSRQMYPRFTLYAHDTEVAA